jgi:hypothetical protein
VFSAKADVMFGSDRFHPSATGYANMVSVLVPSIAAEIRDPEDETPATTMPLEHAAAVAELEVGTEVRRQGRRAAIERRRQIIPRKREVPPPVRSRRSRIPAKQDN